MTLELIYKLKQITKGFFTFKYNVLLILFTYLFICLLITFDVQEDFLLLQLNIARSGYPSSGGNPPAKIRFSLKQGIVFWVCSAGFWELFRCTSTRWCSADDFVTNHSLYRKFEYTWDVFQPAQHVFENYFSVWRHVHVPTERSEGFSRILLSQKTFS